MNKPKHAAPTMPLKKAAELALRTRDELFVPGSDDYIAQTRLIDFASTTDKNVANELLIISGFLCAALGILLAIVGSIYVPLGDLVASEALQPYAGGFGLAALLCHLGVRR